MSKYLTQKSEKVFLLNINVKPNSKIQKITDDGEFLTIFLKSKPIQNRANKELLKLLKNKLKGEKINQLKIISGIKSSNKTIELIFLVGTDVEDVIQKIKK